MLIVNKYSKNTQGTSESLIKGNASKKATFSNNLSIMYQNPGWATQTTE